MAGSGYRWGREMTSSMSSGRGVQHGLDEAAAAARCRASSLTRRVASGRRATSAMLRAEELRLHVRADGRPGAGHRPAPVLRRVSSSLGEGDDGVDDGSAGKRQSLSGAACAQWVAEAEAKSCLELVGLGEKHGLTALERRPRRGERSERLLALTARCPDARPVELGPGS